VADRLSGLLDALAPNPWILLAAVLADLAFGDPVYQAHPIRLIGGALSWIERRLRAAGLDGYGGGILLFALLAGGAWVVLGSIMSLALPFPYVAWLVHGAVAYSLFALGDLLHHVSRIERAVAAGDLDGARRAATMLVGRDADRMDGAACRRAGVESLSENLTDGFVSPVFWYAVGGLPGLVLFKVVSTMDSMVGYKTDRYLRFGWCGARLDDVMNYVPARVTWVVLAAVAAVLPSYSGRKAWRVGLAQHAVLLGPNSGWSEAAAAGALERRLVGPIWLKGVQVTDVWIGDPADPPLATAADVRRSQRLAVVGGLVVTGGAMAVLVAVRALLSIPGIRL
jgi:adenosylcobinamide-phosphate synthase